MDSGCGFEGALKYISLWIPHASLGRERTQECLHVPYKVDMVSRPGFTLELVEDYQWFLSCIHNPRPNNLPSWSRVLRYRLRRVDCENV